MIDRRLLVVAEKKDTTDQIDEEKDTYVEASGEFSLSFIGFVDLDRHRDAPS